VVAILGGSGFQHGETSRLLRPFLRWLLPDWSPAQIGELHGWLRKGAHVVEYAITAALAYRALHLTRGPLARRAAALPVLGLVACVALLDEGRQSRLTHRSGSARDVALDVAGGALGLAAASWLVRRRSDDTEGGPGDG